MLGSHPAMSTTRTRNASVVSCSAYSVTSLVKIFMSWLYICDSYMTLMRTSIWQSHHRRSLPLRQQEEVYPRHLRGLQHLRGCPREVYRAGTSSKPRWTRRRHCLQHRRLVHGTVGNSHSLREERIYCSGCSRSFPRPGDREPTFGLKAVGEGSVAYYLFAAGV